MKWQHIRVLLVLLLVVFPALVLGQDDLPEDYSIHVVQRGENLFRIALNYSMTAEALASLNGITNAANIQVGQRLLVPKMSAAMAGDTPPEAVLDAGIANGDVTITHTVQAGETLFGIGLMYDVNVNEIAMANGITDPTRIFGGQQLVIPGVSPPPFLSNLPASVASLQLMPIIFSEGKTGQVRLETAQPSEVTATFLDRELTVITFADQRRHLMYIGIPTFTEPGVYPLRVEIMQQGADATVVEGEVQVVGGGYGSEVINLLEGRDTLLAETGEEAELDLLRRATATFTPERYFRAPMGLPAAAGITSRFGTRRSYNGGAFDRYHSGTDFAGAPGTPIFAPAPGRVVLADSLNIRGNATMIDHGWGIHTGYWHQTEIYVAPGDQVETGQIIGTIGSTGRVTGAHLHWELWVNGVPVDPMQWVQQSFVWE